MTASDYARVEAVATNEQRYRKEWATLTGRSESEIYVPEGVRMFNDMPILEPKPQKKEHTDDGIKQSLIPLGATAGERRE